MYQIGQLIIYENTGVCEVTAFTTPAECPALSGMPEERRYYVLRPVFGRGVIYTPVDSKKAFTRPVISRAEAERLLHLVPTLSEKAYYARNLQSLKDHYRSAVSTHDCEELLSLTMSVHQKRLAAEENGKRIGQVDEKYMRQAEEQLFGELAVALEIDRDEVPKRIAETVAACRARAEEAVVV